MPVCKAFAGLVPGAGLWPSEGSEQVVPIRYLTSAKSMFEKNISQGEFLVLYAER